MKVLIVNESLDLGGVERGSIDLANALNRRNIKIYFASSPGILFEKLNPNIKFFKLPKFRIFSVWRIIKVLSKIISDIKPDIVHSQGATMAILSGIAIERSRVKSINILTRHTRQFHRMPQLASVYLLNKYCNHVIAISPSTKDNLIKAGIKCGASLIPAFIYCDKINQFIKSTDNNLVYKKLNISKNNYIVTIISRLIPDKKIDKFIKILAACSEPLDKKPVGLIIGKGPDEQELKKLAAQYKDKVRILFLGYQENIFEYLAISNIFLFPSGHQEVLPAVLVEALAAGVPVVCSNIFGNNEIVKHRHNGFLINHDINDYVQYVVKILKNKNLRLRLSVNGQKTARDKFDKKIIINKTLSLYRNILR